MTLSSLFQQLTGSQPDQTIPLSPAGSNRQYFRLFQGKQSYIGVIGTSQEENNAFLYMAQHFHEKGLNVPQVYAVSDDQMTYIQQDLGSTLLFDYIAQGRGTGIFSEQEKLMLRKTIRTLAQFQVKATEHFDFGQCYPQPEFNRRSIMWDLNYFKYCFLKGTGVEFQEDKLENDFEALADTLLQVPSDTFLYRDFQSRNVMLYKGEPYFIDFQGGRKGPYYYDVASFLWQAKANYPDELRKELIEEYLKELSCYKHIDRQEFYSTLPHFVLFRTLQVLGAYGFRGYFERKPHFLQSIPYALNNLRQLLTENNSHYPYLCHISDRLTALPLFQPTAGLPHLTPDTPTLTVTIYSFSYKKGIPADPSGNGGGFVFDCRATHNPGKYEQYKTFTGTDQPVIEFLEKDGEILTFLESVYRLTDASVKRYIQRGFTSLMISFGCTGGQHRSVYAAEHTAQHIHDTFGVKVHLIHREQSIERILP